MPDLSKHPILRQISEVIHAIEICGASPALTNAVCKAHALYVPAEVLVDSQTSVIESFADELPSAPPIPPRLTPADIENAIESESYLVYPGTVVTVAMLVLRNGTKVVGFNYGSIDPAKQDWAEGQRQARAMAVERVWELEGYALRERLAAAAA